MKNILLILLFFQFKKIDLNKNSNLTDCSYGYVYDGEECEECGKTDVDPVFKIVRGEIAIPHSWPAQALVLKQYLVVKNESTKKDKIEYLYSFQCGGTLINENTILTAAHCLSKEFDEGVIFKANEKYPKFESTIRVYLGAHDIRFTRNKTTINSPPSTIISVNVSKIKIHPNYNFKSSLNDIAILKLDKNIKTNKYIKYACLPKQKSDDFPKINDELYAVGWGKLHEENDYVPKLLRNVKLINYKPSKCENVFKEIKKDWKLQLCAGDLKNLKDTCQGDSGGPLYVFDKKIDRYVVTGIVSYGEGCALRDKPGIYTRISEYIDWIKKYL